mmetsp:Transcript_18928/g.54853  ORF Transcript_18928/g.54853 Transcript_18928/m.54853 type:complete len:244 (-) Transcript_18928:7-738(-)
MARTLHNLGIARTLRGDYRRAKRALARSLLMFERHCGPYHVDVARVHDAAGSLEALRGRPHRALDRHVSSLRIKSAILNPHHPSLLGSMMRVAAGHRALGQLDEAECALREVLECQGVALLRSMDPSYRRSMTGLVGKTMRMIGEIQRERNEGECPAVVVVAPSTTMTHTPPPPPLSTIPPPLSPGSMMSSKGGRREQDDDDDDDACTLSFSVSSCEEIDDEDDEQDPVPPSFQGSSADDWGI